MYFFILSVIKLAIAGDLHGSWLKEDHDLLLTLQPDGILFVGDLGNGNICHVQLIKKISIPTAVILGNHDRGSDLDGDQLKKQLTLLGKKDCSWRLCEWNDPKVAIVGARPCSAGGGYHLSSQMKAVFGDVHLQQSIERIVTSARKASSSFPLIILAHSGPCGLGSEASSICGRDWKKPSIDWGDKDLALAIDEIYKDRSIDLVVFGHTHHQLKLGKGLRKTFFYDQRRKIAYLNAACVPRRGFDANNNLLVHFSWVEFTNGMLTHVSHRWYNKSNSLEFIDTLYSI